MTAKELARKIDHTLLRPDATEAEVQKAILYGREIGAASVCIHPCNVPLATQLLHGSDTAVCTVIGFPLGATNTSVKVAEAMDAWLNGARELDMVLNIGALKSGDEAYVHDDIRTVVNTTPAVVKVILETGYLSDKEIATACRIAESAGASFVKTSTGFGPRGASVEDIQLMRRHVSREVGIKASGGMYDLADALAMLQAGATRLGMSRTFKIMTELAAKS